MVKLCGSVHEGIRYPPKRRFDALSPTRFGWAGDVTAAQHDPETDVANAKGSQSNNLYFYLAIFGRIASLQIACLAELNGAFCAWPCIPNPAVKMHNLLLYEPYRQPSSYKP